MLQIEGHEMTIIATEISYVRPFTIDSLFTVNGERFDFVLDANKAPRDYWIRLKTLYPCRTPLEAFAVLRYGSEHQMAADTRVTFTETLPPRLSTDFPEEKVFNSPNPSVYPGVPLLNLRSYESDNSIIESTPDHKFFLFIDSPTILDDTMDKYGNYYRLACKSVDDLSSFHLIEFPSFFFDSVETSKQDFNSIGTFNNISLKFPAFPLLTQPDDIDEAMFCHENTTEGKFCFDNKFLTACRCIHRIKLDLNSIVELVLVNVDDQIPHPIHLHGHKFHVLDMGVYDKKPEPGFIKREGIPLKTHRDPPYKDTVVLPYPGYTRLRFRANNPGFWLMHCHFDWHLTTGEFGDTKSELGHQNFPSIRYGDHFSSRRN